MVRDYEIHPPTLNFSVRSPQHSPQLNLPPRRRMESNAAFLDDLDEFLDASSVVLTNNDFPLEFDDANLLLDYAVNTDALRIATPPSQFDCASQTSSSNSEQEESTAKATLRAKETKRRQAYRQRQRNEREVLQAEAKLLSEKLEKLKQTTKETAGQLELLISPDKLWKTAAIVELESRKHAEEQHKRLVEAVIVRDKIINDLTRITKKRIASAPRSRQVVRLQPPDNTLYTAFLRELEIQYSQTDKVFKNCGFESMSEGASQSAHQDLSDDGVKHFQRFTKMLYPAQFNSVCDEMWRISRMHLQDYDAEPFDGVKNSGSTIAVKFRRRRVLNDGSVASIRPLLVLRCICEDNNMTLVWKVFANGEGIFDGIHDDEVGWCRVRSSTDVDLPGTLIEIYARRTLLCYSDEPLREDLSDLFNDIIHCEINAEEEDKLVEDFERLVIEKKLYGFDSSRNE